MSKQSFCMFRKPALRCQTVQKAIDTKIDIWYNLTNFYLL